jgi:hypothetical protein
MPSVFLDSPPSSIVPYYQMDTPGRSAGATMRTVLESTGVGVTGLPSQAVLMAEGRAASSSGEPQGTWQVDSKGLYAVLRNRRSPGASFFTLESYGLDNPIENPNASIVHGITHFNAACAVLTGAGEHWAVVTGYQTDNAGRLQFFCVHDPEPPLTDPTNPDHIPGTGVPNEIVQALAWNDRRYCRIAIGREWVNRYLLVRVGMSLPFAQSAPQGTFQQQPRADGRNLIAADRAHDVACDCMAELGLTGLADYAAAFARASAAEPVLVQDLSRRGGFYYLLRYQARGGDIAAVAIDANRRAAVVGGLSETGDAAESPQGRDRRTRDALLREGPPGRPELARRSAARLDHVARQAGVGRRPERRIAAASICAGSGRRRTPACRRARSSRGAMGRMSGGTTDEREP